MCPIGSSDEATPNFVFPKNVLDLNDQQIDQLLEGIRIRRMLKLQVYTETMKEKERALIAKVEARLERKSEQFVKQLESVDRALEKLEHITNEIRGLRLQMGLDPMG